MMTIVAIFWQLYTMYLAMGMPRGAAARLAAYLARLMFNQDFGV